MDIKQIKKVEKKSRQPRQLRCLPAPESRPIAVFPLSVAKTGCGEISEPRIGHTGGFDRDPRLVWEWYNWRRELIATKQPNPAHHALASWKNVSTRLQWSLKTSMVFMQSRKSEINRAAWNIWKVRCTKCGEMTENIDVPIKILPYCNRCNGMLRPHIVWFGEVLSRTAQDRSSNVRGVLKLPIRAVSQAPLRTNNMGRSIPLQRLQYGRILIGTSIFSVISPHFVHRTFQMFPCSSINFDFRLLHEDHRRFE